MILVALKMGQCCCQLSRRTHFDILVFSEDNAVNVVDTDFMEY